MSFKEGSKIEVKHKTYTQKCDVTKCNFISEDLDGDSSIITDIKTSVLHHHLSHKPPLRSALLCICRSKVLYTAVRDFIYRISSNKDWQSKKSQVLNIGRGRGQHKQIKGPAKISVNEKTRHSVTIILCACQPTIMYIFIAFIKSKI